MKTNVKNIVATFLCVIMLAGILPAGMVSAEGILSWIDIEDSYRWIYYDETCELWTAQGDGKVDILNSNGEKLVSLECSYMEPVNEELFVLRRQDGMCGMIDITGKIAIPFEYDYIKPINEELFIAIQKDYMYGVVDITGQIVIPFEYKNLSKISEKFLLCENSEYKTGVIDISGKEIVPCEYDYYDVTPVTDDCVVLEKYNDYDEKGNRTIAQCELKSLSDGSQISLSYKQCNAYNGMLVVCDQNDMWGIIDTKGNEVVPCAYEQITCVADNFFVVKGEGNVEVFDIEGNSTIKKECDSYSVLEDNFIYIYKYTDYPKYEYELYSLNGKFLCSGNGDLSIVWWENIAKDEYAMIQENDKCGIVDIDGNIILPLEYEGLLFTNSSEYFIAYKNDKAGIIDITGKELIPCVYDAIDYRSPNFILVTNGDYWDADSNYERGVITLDGDEIIPLSNKDFEIDTDDKGTYVIFVEGSEYGRRFAKLRTMQQEAEDKFVLGIGIKKASVWGELKDNDVAPVLKESRTMLPARFVAENLGAEVSWIGEEQKVIIKGNGKEIVLKIDSNIATVNGKEKQIDSPAFVENDRTYTPVRFIAEELGAKVDWDDANQNVIITK